MKKESFNNGWLCYKGGGTALEKTVNPPEAPVEVTLPHDAMIGEYRDPKICTGNATGYYPYKTVHYIKEFELNDVSGSCFIKFEGVYKNTSVFVNGCLVKQHSNGYTPFNIDISPFVKIGKNSIKVLVRNGVPSSRWYAAPEEGMTEFEAPRHPMREKECVTVFEAIAAEEFGNGAPVSAMPSMAKLCYRLRCTVYKRKVSVFRRAIIYLFKKDN